MLQGSAHAAEPSATAEPLLNKKPIAHSVPSAEKKARAVHGKKAKPKTRVGKEKVDAQATVKQDSVTETPSGSIQQSIQLRGVRG
jgi:hypothetical protein